MNPPSQWSPSWSLVREEKSSPKPTSCTDCCLDKHCSTGWRASPAVGARSYCPDRRLHTEGRASFCSRRCQTGTQFTCEASREEGQWKARCPSPRQEKHLEGGTATGNSEMGGETIVALAPEVHLGASTRKWRTTKLPPPHDFLPAAIVLSRTNNRPTKHLRQRSKHNPCRG